MSHMVQLRGNRGGFVVWALLVPVLVVALVATGFTGYRAGWFNEFLCEGECPVEFAVLPEGVDEMRASSVTVREPASRAIDAAALERALEEPLSDPALGPRVGFVAADAATGEILTSRETGGHIPASTTKVLTAWGVLTALGPDHQFSTLVRHDGDTLTLVGGGDPYLLSKRAKRRWAGTSLEQLAKETATALGRTTVKLEYEDTLFAGSLLNSTWPSRFVPRTVQPITALNARQLPASSATPSQDAAEDFATYLKKHGVKVSSIAESRERSTAEVVAEGKSAPLHEIASKMLAISDNTGSEILLRHIAIAQGGESDFAGGIKALTNLLDQAGLPSKGLELKDGSGLSRDNRISPTLLVHVLRSTLNDDQYAALITGLPVSGLSGSLTERFGFSRDARGVVRAKTGTLIGVSSLAGWASLPDGQTIVFAVMADSIDGYPLGPPQDAIDRIAAAIAGCGC